MSFIEISVFMIIVPLPSYRLPIIFHEDISTLSHIPIKCLHNRWFLKIFSEFFRRDEKLSIRKKREWYSLEYIVLDFSREIFLTRPHRDDIGNRGFWYELYDPILVVLRLDPVSPISCLLTVSEKCLCDCVFSDLTPYIKSEDPYRRCDPISRKKYKKNIGHSRIYIASITLIIEDPLCYFHD